MSLRTRTIYRLHSIYRFDKLSNPYFYLLGNYNYEYRTEDFSDIKCRLCNFKAGYNYWFVAENTHKKFRTAVKEGEYSISEIFDEEPEFTSGKWYFSLWENQHKIDETTLLLEPKLLVYQTNAIDLEGNDVKVRVIASEACFENQAGDYVDNTDYTIGEAKLELEDESVKAVELENYIYIDSLGIMKKIVFTPSVWGVRTKASHNMDWDKSLNINIEPDDIDSSACAIVSSALADISVNKGLFDVDPGINRIRISKYLRRIKRKQIIEISDGVNIVSVKVGCIPQYKLYNVKCNIRMYI